METAPIKGIPRAACRRRLPPIQLGLLIDVGDIPVVLARFNSPLLAKTAIQAALRAAGELPGELSIGQRQQARLFEVLLRELSE